MEKFKKGDVIIVTITDERAYNRGEITIIDEDDSFVPYIKPHLSGSICIVEYNAELLSSIPLKNICVHTPTKEQWDEVHEAVNSIVDKDRWRDENHGIGLRTDLYTSNCAAERQSGTNFVISFEDWKTYLKPNVVSKPIEEDIHKGLIVGEKYVPLKKSIRCSLESSVVWNTRGGKEQGFLYYRGYDKDAKVYKFSENIHIGYDFFMPDDVILYSIWLEQQKPVNNTPQWIKDLKKGDKVERIKEYNGDATSGQVFTIVRDYDEDYPIYYRNGGCVCDPKRFDYWRLVSKASDKPKELTDEEKLLAYVKEHDLEIVPYIKCSECYAQNNLSKDCLEKGFKYCGNDLMINKMFVKKSTVQEVEIGDIVVVTKEFHVNEAIPGHIAKLVNKDSSSTPYCVDSCDYEYVWCCGVRKATQEEINAYNAGYLTLEAYQREKQEIRQILKETPVEDNLEITIFEKPIKEKRKLIQVSI